MTDALLWRRVEDLRRLLPRTETRRLAHPALQLFAKMECANPSGGVKDRAAYWVLREAIRRGEITRDSIVVESSSGNFALSMAFFCARLGIKFIPVLDPNVNSSTERTLRQACDRVEKVDRADGAGGFLISRLARVADLVAEIDGAYWPDQYANADGARGHYELTGRELVEDLGRIDYLFVGLGTGATIAGISQRVTESNAGAAVMAVDVEGSVISGGPPSRRSIPGIGSSIHPPMIDHAVITDFIIMSEWDEVIGCRDLLREHGIMAGGSTGCVYAAIRRHFDDHRGPSPVVAFLCADRGEPYADTIYNPAWVAANLGPRRALAGARPLARRPEGNHMATRAAVWTSPPADEEGFISWLHARCEEDPVQAGPRNGRWHIFGYQEAVHVLSDHVAFSNAVATDAQGSAFKLFKDGSLSWMDPPRHTQLRAVVSRFFTPRYVADLEPMIGSTVEEFLGKIRSKTRVEFIGEFATPIISAVLGKMVGVPPRGQELFRRWSKDLLSLMDPGTTSNRVSAVAASTRLIDVYLHEYVKRRRQAPREDLVGELLTAEVDGEPLTDDEVVGVIGFLLSSGQAAPLTLGNVVICLDQHPDAAARLRADRGLLQPALDEVMRYRNQTTRVARRTVRDVSIGKHVIPAGQDVLVWLAAANRDGRKFERPDAFEIDRPPDTNLALGHGIHYCLGAALSRLEISIALDRLLAQTRSFSVDYAASRLLDPRLTFGASELWFTADWTGGGPAHAR
ncbi:MAG TPA: 2,3-diaminopropionate biosynthesis protein SbnA [Streptosporangiaceae bacterium]|nr:2,3-diaminopropionate biosynthesis protein SbnA [Streptosporangiaceae bacterium]